MIDFSGMPPNTFHILAKLVEEVKGPKGWTFRLKSEHGALRLVINIDGYDNNEKSWRRWIYEMCRRTMNHELGECLRFGPEELRPFVPMHGPGEDPYTVHEWRPEVDAFTSQDGSLGSGHTRKR